MEVSCYRSKEKFIQICAKKYNVHKRLMMFPIALRALTSPIWDSNLNWLNVNLLFEGCLQSMPVIKWVVSLFHNWSNPVVTHFWERFGRSELAVNTSALEPIWIGIWIRIAVQKGLTSQVYCVDCRDETNILNNFLSVLMLVWQFVCHCGCYLHGTIVITWRCWCRRWLQSW